MKLWTEKKKLPLKTEYYLSFFFLIVIPLLVVLFAALLVLNQKFKKQALENIQQAQETILAELKSDIDVMSMRLSHLIYTNNNEILDYAAQTNTPNAELRYEYRQKLQQAGNLALEPVKEIVSVGFYMKDGSETYIKNDIRRSVEEIRQKSWYQKALGHANAVCVGSYDTLSVNDLYIGGKRDLLILVFALAPDITTDRSQKIEMVAFYQSTGAADRIREYNQSYLNGKNKLGVTQICDANENLIFSTTESYDLNLKDPSYVCVRTPLELNDTVWYLESYIKNTDLSLEYWSSAVLVLMAAILILTLAAFYSRHFLRSIVNPIEAICGGLRQVEEGNLNLHLAPEGQYEVRSMIHQFNAMVRRLRALISEYEERVHSVEKTPGDYLAALVRGTMTPEEVCKKSKEFFAEEYTLLGFWITGPGQAEVDSDLASRLAGSFERNPRYASRCITCILEPHSFLAFYRITEEDYQGKLMGMLTELQKVAAKKAGAALFVCVEQKDLGPDSFLRRLSAIQRKMCLRHLCRETAVLDFGRTEGKENLLLDLSGSYQRLANALCIADEKNVLEEKEKLFAFFSDKSMQEIKLHTLAVILAIGIRASQDNSSLAEIFGRRYDYPEKMERIEDHRSLKLWLTNYFAWITEYSASRLNLSEADVIIRAKRYIANHYEEPDLSLSAVAAYVELSEKYFSNRFTKETGETFSSYLTALRMQKAKELLRTTTFKIYEISEMAGYHNVEHFNRVFKKLNGITPAQYRKAI